MWLPFLCTGSYVQEVRYAAGAWMRRSGVVQVVLKTKSICCNICHATENETKEDIS